MAARKYRHRPGKTRYRILVSSCLAGIKCAYNGRDRANRRVKALFDRGEALAVCAEVLGGLPVPRENAEIVGGDGRAVWNKDARVVTVSGKDVTGNFRRGAKTVLDLAKRHNIKKAILKSKSPSCGAGKIYDGTFTNVLTEGDGVLTSLLRRNRIKIHDERSPSI